jgi:mRNA degradation ribonuclease J1/J2
MWSGYLHGATKIQKLADFLAPYNATYLHTSGHATLDALRKLYETVKPTRGLIPIHSSAPERFEKIIPNGNIIFLDDGKPFEL